MPDRLSHPELGGSCINLGRVGLSPRKIICVSNVIFDKALFPETWCGLCEHVLGHVTVTGVRVLMSYTLQGAFLTAVFPRLCACQIGTFSHGSCAREGRDQSGSALSEGLCNLRSQPRSVRDSTPRPCSCGGSGCMLCNGPLSLGEG